MNAHAIGILFLKDLFLSRQTLFAYFFAGILFAALACINNETIAFPAIILVITVAIASGIHLIGTLLLGEAIDQTRLFVMSQPVSLLEYSIAKIAVVLTTYLIPWATMLACISVFSFLLPGAKPGAVAVTVLLFGFLLASFTLQLVTAVVTESIGWTICVVVAGNVLLNVFLKHIFSFPEIAQVAKSELLTWPPIVLQLLAAECGVVFVALALAVFVVTRPRDLV
jgi:hypothetical protein